jgi:mannose-6-phosphate isomerase-like protein (cupin superfamily)
MVAQDCNPKVQLWKDLPVLFYCGEKWRETSISGDHATIIYHWISGDCGPRTFMPREAETILMTLSGSQILSIFDESFVCATNSVSRIPCGVPFQLAPKNGSPAMCLDISADILPEAAMNEPQNFNLTDDLRPVDFTTLPVEMLADGKLRRSAFRAAGSMIVFNRIDASLDRPPPHHHPFDQMVMTVKGAMMFEIAGQQFNCPAHSVVRVPGDMPHTGRPIGDDELWNFDVFAPERNDYAHLVSHQRAFF